MSTSEIIDLSAAQAVAAIEAGRLSATELFEVYRVRAAADELNCFTWVAPGTGEAQDRWSPARRAARCQGPLLHGRRALAVGVAHPRGLPPALHRHRRCAARCGRGAAACQDQPGRVCDGLLQRELRLRPGAQPVGSRARARGVVGGQRRRRRRRPRSLGARHRHRRIDPPACRAVRDRRAETDLRRRLALRDDRVRLLARSGRARSPAM